MEDETILNLYKQLLELAEKGDETKTAEVMAQRFAELPEDMQGEILTRLYFKSLEERAEEIETIPELQERTMEVIGELEIQQKKLEDEGKTGE